MEFEAKLKTVTTDLGADFFGIADLSPARETIKTLWNDVAATFPRAVSFGIALSHAIVDQQPNRFTSVVAMNYRRHAYDVVNQRLDAIASHVSGIIHRHGSRALPIPTTQPDTYNDNHYGLFSQKMAARLAGLGWIGKCCLLVTPEVGPRVRWGSVLTVHPCRRPKTCWPTAAAIAANVSTSAR